LDIIDYLITNIKPLPWIVKGPGLGLMVLLVFRSFTQVLTIRWIKAVTSIVYAAIIALGMARFGQDIADHLKTKQIEPANEVNQSSDTGQN